MSELVGDEPRDGDGVSGRYKCDICDRTFSQKKDLLHHAYIHKENPKYDCPICGKILTSKVGYDRHVGSHEKGRKTVKCKICQAQCSSKTDLEEHHRKFHLEQKPFTCEICKAEFSWEENLHKHQRMHLVENYQCEMCNKVFVDTISLKVHMRTHTEKKNAPESLKPYGCKLCGQRFQYDFSYSAHMRLHEAGAVPSIAQQTNRTTKTNVKENIPKVSIPDKISVGNVQMHRKDVPHRVANNRKPELSNARILPAFVPPKNYRPYPKMPAPGAKPENLLNASKSIGTKDLKVRDNSKTPGRKSTALRFGDLSMTQETPFKCNLCDKSFRWEVSLKVHKEEHLNGQQLTAAEKRRRERYAKQRNLPSMLARKRKVAPVTPKATERPRQKEGVSPKKSRLVKRTAGSDDEDSDVELEPQNASPSKSAATSISSGILQTNKDHSKPNKSSHANVSYVVSNRPNQPAKSVTNKSEAAEPQPDANMPDPYSSIVSITGHAKDNWKSQPVSTGISSVTKLCNEHKGSLVGSYIQRESQHVPCTTSREVPSVLTHNSRNSSAESDKSAKNRITRSHRPPTNQNLDTLKLESNQFENPPHPNEIDKVNLESTEPIEDESPTNPSHKPTHKTSTKRGGKKGKGKVKSTSSSSPRRSARLKFSEPQTETEIEESVAEMTEIANTTFEEAMASIKVPLVENNSEIQMVEFNNEGNSLNPLNISDPIDESHAIEQQAPPQLREISPVITTTNERTTDGPYFLSAQDHVPMIANIIHDDKTVEQVQVVECIKAAIKVDDDDDDNDGAASISSLPQEDAYEYNESGSQPITQAEAGMTQQIFDSQHERANTANADLEVKNDPNFYTDLNAVSVTSSLPVDTSRYQYEPYINKSRGSQSMDYSTSVAHSLAGRTSSLGSNITVNQNSPAKSTMTFSTIDSANIYGAANSALFQNEANKPEMLIENSPDGATKAYSQEKTERVTVIEPIQPEYVPFTGSMLEALNNPISATSFSHLYPGPVAEDIEGFPSREKRNLSGSINQGTVVRSTASQMQGTVSETSPNTRYMDQRQNDGSHSSQSVEKGKETSFVDLAEAVEYLKEMKSQRMPAEEAKPEPKVESPGSHRSGSQDEPTAHLQNKPQSYRFTEKNTETGITHSIQAGTASSDTSHLQRLSTHSSNSLQASPPHDVPSTSSLPQDQSHTQTSINQPIQTIIQQQQLLGSQRVVMQGDQGAIYQSNLMQNAVTVNQHIGGSVVENQQQVRNKYMETTSMPPPNKTVHEAKIPSNIQQTNPSAPLAQPIQPIFMSSSVAGPGSQTNSVMNASTQPTSESPEFKSRPSALHSNKSTISLNKAINAPQSNQLDAVRLAATSAAGSQMSTTGAQMLTSHAITSPMLATSLISAMTQPSIANSQALTMESQNINQAVNLSIPRFITANPQEAGMSMAQTANIASHNMIAGATQNQASILQNVINLSQPVYSAPIDNVAVTQSMNSVVSHTIPPKQTQSDVTNITKRAQKQNKQQGIFIQPAPPAQMLLSPSRLNASTLLPGSGVQGIAAQGSNQGLILQGQPGLQGLGGIQIVNAQGAIQTIQPHGGMQVLTNQGIQNIQAPGALPPGFQPALQPGLQPNPLQTALPPGVQVVQNQQQENVGLLGGGAQPSQAGGYQLVQTPAGIQMVPIQQTFPTAIQGALPFTGFQTPQGPISMINMNITNNVQQAPVQPFQAQNMAAPNPLQPGGTTMQILPQTPAAMAPQAQTALNPGMMSSPITCLNQFGDMVTVTPLFQIPIEQLQQQQQSVQMQNNIITHQNLALNQGTTLVQMPMNMDQSGQQQVHALNMAAAMAANVGQSSSDMPINMVCKDNVAVTGRSAEEAIDVMKEESSSSQLIVA